jgi:hypothetical protein
MVTPEVVSKPTLISRQEDPDRLSEGAGMMSAPTKVLADTIWIADWTLDSGTAPGWTAIDNRILNNGQTYWSTSSRYAGTGEVVGKAAVLRAFMPCWTDTGYGNNWDQSLKVNYQGTSARLAFDVVLETESSDGLTIEADEHCRSQVVSGDSVPAMWRSRLPGPDTNRLGGGFISQRIDLALPSSTGPSCVYIRFSSDGAESNEDGLFTPELAAALVVDNIEVTGDLSYIEDFESQTWNATSSP